MSSRHLIHAGRATLCGGFTFLEVLAMLLVLTLGLLATIGLHLVGTRNAAKAQAASTAMATAIAVAYDETPFLDPLLASGWSVGGTPAARTASGFINGYWASRSETTGAADVIASDAAGTVVMRSARVDVVVREAQGGATLAMFSTRLIRQKGAP